MAPKAILPDPATGYYNPFPSFFFSGPLRPVYPLSEHRTLPKSIPHPVWWQDGNPRYSRSLTNRNKIEVLDAEGQEAMRKSCRLAREVLDIAAAAAKPGVTTDYIDEVVHKACIERNVSQLLFQTVQETRSVVNLLLQIFRIHSLVEPWRTSPQGALMEITDILTKSLILLR